MKRTRAAFRLVLLLVTGTMLAATDTPSEVYLRLAAPASGALDAQGGWLGAPQAIAPGVELYRSTDPSLVEPPGPISVLLLKLDPARVRLASVLSNDEVVGAEPVDGIAARHKAVAAINGGFFNVKNGEPVGLLKVARELVSDTGVTKGAVAIRAPTRGRTTLEFDQVAARVSMTFKVGTRTYTVPIDGVDTTRERGKLMLYTPAYHAHSDTAANGTEWALGGQPFRVLGTRVDMGRTPIPRDGAVLSFGGLELPPALAALTQGVTVRFLTTWTTVNGLTGAQLESADHVVNGAGLLRLRGRLLDNWERTENLVAQSFITARHPRTIIGVDSRGAIWLAAIDGRQPDYSVGMTFADLQRLCDRLGLQNALNLDGGGSTTMVVKDRVVNRPSDPAGPRPVSDAILVLLR